MQSKFLIHLGVFSALVLLSSPGLADNLNSEHWGGLKRMMSVEEFHAAGLDKLDAGELDRLNKWILQYMNHGIGQAVKAERVRTEKRMAQKTVRQPPQFPERRHIVGHFRGWYGDTVFTLDNGEVWKQRLPGYYAASMENPEVEISKNFLGYYVLKIIKNGYKIGVKRIK